jgi:hypothetical protein
LITELLPKLLLLSLSLLRALLGLLGLAAGFVHLLRSLLRLLFGRGSLLGFKLRLLLGLFRLLSLQLSLLLRLLRLLLYRLLLLLKLPPLLGCGLCLLPSLLGTSALFVGFLLGGRAFPLRLFCLLLRALCLGLSTRCTLLGFAALARYAGLVFRPNRQGTRLFCALDGAASRRAYGLVAVVRVEGILGLPQEVLGTAQSVGRVLVGVAAFGNTNCISRLQQIQRSILVISINIRCRRSCLGQVHRTRKYLIVHFDGFWRPFCRGAQRILSDDKFARLRDSEIRLSSDNKRKGLQVRGRM